MEELVAFIARSLVDEPDEVKVTSSEDEECITVELAVASGDLGKVIGKQGRTCSSLFTDYFTEISRCDGQFNSDAFFIFTAGDFHFIRFVDK